MFSLRPPLEDSNLDNADAYRRKLIKIVPI